MIRKGKAMNAVELVIPPRMRDLGEGFMVNRALPYAKRRAVGPFVFFDEMGPADFPPGEGIDVRPHPHIGLATVTYLFEGSILHRDSLGSLQAIRPGEVNWMTAGRGIVHSERTAPEHLEHGQRLHGIQTWVALPLAMEETEPAFLHYPADDFPHVELDGAAVRVVAGSAFGATSPLVTASPTVYLDIVLQPQARLVLPAMAQERAIYTAIGEATLDGEGWEKGAMPVLTPGAEPELRAGPQGARVILVGGEPLDGGTRVMFWNFVSSRAERIEQAKQDWREGRFPLVPGDETEFIPLPE